jgi:DNA-binding transcriptional regulator GbsR (MarR family)
LEYQGLVRNMASTSEIADLNLNLISNFSPSVQKIYEILLMSDQMTITDIREKTQYSRRTVSFALRQLIKVGLITRVPKLLDMRRYHYTLSSKH